MVDSGGGSHYPKPRINIHAFDLLAVVDQDFNITYLTPDQVYGEGRSI